MEQTGKTGSPVEQAARSLQDRQGVRERVNSREARRVVEMLGDRQSVQAAARAAAAGNTSELMGMMQRLMGTREGAQLVERLSEQAKRSGLKET